MLLIHARSNTRLTLKELREGRSSGEIESVSHLIRHQFVGLQQDFCFLNRSPIDPIHHTLIAYFLNQCRQMMWRDMEFTSIERYRPLFLTVLMNESFEPNKKALRHVSVLHFGWYRPPHPLSPERQRPLPAEGPALFYGDKA